jgi:glyoxylase-like metal-dependent hydrolase (beta-lactamase superfamily II)
VTRIERVLAPNPGPFTGPGTNTYVIESAGQALIVDPGPVVVEHLRAVRLALNGLSPVAVLVTHTHPDHAPAANGLARELDVPSLGFAPGRDFVPSRRLEDGAEIAFGDEQLIAVHTPGHTSDHLCFRLGDLLFTGDHIMGGSTVIIEDAAAYMHSLEKVAALHPACLYPGHGPELPEAQRVITELIAHRVEREQQILEAIDNGATTIGDIVAAVYVGLDPSLGLAATMQVHTQLIKLRDEGRVSLGGGGAHTATVVKRAERQ